MLSLFNAPRANQWQQSLLFAPLLAAAAAIAQPVPASLTSFGPTIYRTNAQETGTIEEFAGQVGTVIGMTLVPIGTTVTGCGEGDVLAVENTAGGRFWRVDGARAGSPLLTEIGRLPPSLAVSSIAFAHGRLFAIDGDAEFFELSPITFQQIGTAVDLLAANSRIGGVAFNGVDTWFATNGSSDRLIRLPDPPTASGWDPFGVIGFNFGTSGIEWYQGRLWGALHGAGQLRVGEFDLSTGAFSSSWTLVNATEQNVGFVAFQPECLDVTMQPSNAIACPTGAANFSLAAAGAGLSFQWQIEGGLGVWHNLSNGLTVLPCGGNAVIQSVPSGSPSVRIGVQPCVGVNRYQLRCIVSNDCGTTTSIEASYIVCPADFDCNGSVAVPDIFAFLSAWFAGDDRADFDGVPGITVPDIFAFLSAWFAGCP